MALNNRPGVSAKTKKDVMEAAELYGFDFTRLRSKHPDTGTIRFIMYKRQGAVVTDTLFFSKVYEGVEIGCKNAGYKLQISYIYKDDDVPRQVDEIIYSLCSGVILLGTEMTKDDYEPFSRLTTPMVLLDVYLDFVKCDCILINNVQGACLATDYLISRTKKQPGYLHSSYSISNFEERAEGFFQSIKRHGMPRSKSIVHYLSPSVEGAFSDMLTLLSDGAELAPGYFADNDLIAIGAMKAFQVFGKKIPDDIAIIGFDNMPSAGYVEPSLSTIEVPKQYMGELAAKRLIEIIKDKNRFAVKFEVNTKLVKRRSV
jgi:LacI family transcriptional regulator